MDQPWWQKAVLYQVYVRSFADSNGDGVGDLRGVIDRLDYFSWLGIDGLWLSPVTVSPDRDWGYDVADYRDIQPVFGTMDDLDELIARAGDLDMRIVLDLVPNHTSDRHPWFQDARRSRDAQHRDEGLTVRRRDGLVVAPQIGLELERDARQRRLLGRVVELGGEGNERGRADGTVARASAREGPRQCGENQAPVVHAA